MKSHQTMNPSGRCAGRSVAAPLALDITNRRELHAFACERDWDRLGADELGAIIHRQGARRAWAA